MEHDPGSDPEAMRSLVGSSRPILASVAVMPILIRYLGADSADVYN